MYQERRTNSSEWLIPHTCRPEAEPATDAGPAAGADEDPSAGADAAVEADVAHRRAVEADVAHRREAYVAHRRCELYQALDDPFSPVTGPVRDPRSTGITTGPSRSTSWENLDAQLFDGPDSRRLSLDGMWRAVGSPADKGPLAWIDRARPLLPAFHRYFANLAACGYHERSKHRIFLFIDKEDLDDDHRAGDVITSLWLIAEAYASFLDSVVSSDGLLSRPLGRCPRGPRQTRGHGPGGEPVIRPG